LAILGKKPFLDKNLSKIQKKREEKKRGFFLAILGKKPVLDKNLSKIQKKKRRNEEGISRGNPRQKTAPRQKPFKNPKKREEKKRGFFAAILGKN